jgi:hypothetical protein
MRCANPSCMEPARSPFQGTLWNLEMEVPPEKRTVRAEWGFPVCCVPTRFFWLCEDCSRHLVITRWTPKGLVLGKSVSDRLAVQRLARISPRAGTVEPVTARREELLESA